MICPECGHENNGDLIRCICSYEIIEVDKNHAD
jgi:NMD protein affecting ribosome stability and mRNA decay